MCCCNRDTEKSETTVCLLVWSFSICLGAPQAQKSHYSYARHDFLVHQRMNANGFYCHVIYSPETGRQVKHCSWLQSLRIQQVNAYNDTYSVHNEALMLRRARLLCLLASWERLSVSAAKYQLLISSPDRGAGPPFPPTFMMAPFLPGSTHTLVPMSVTVPFHLCIFRIFSDFWTCVNYLLQ